MRCCGRGKFLLAVALPAAPAWTHPCTGMSPQRRLSWRVRSLAVAMKSIWLSLCMANACQTIMLSV